MTTIITATDAAEFLGLVPALAGFTPRDSLVLLPFRGPRTRGAMRLDLPDEHADPDHFADVAVHALLQVRDIDAVAVVVYSDDDAQTVPDGVLLPRLAAVEALVEVCADAGLRIVDALCVTPSGWAEYLAEEPTLRPLPPGPAVPGVGDVSGDQFAGSALPPSDLVTRELVGRALRDLERTVDLHRAGRIPPGADVNPITLVVVADLLDDLPGFVEHLLERPEDDDPYDCAALLWCLQRPVFRDAILVQWATDLDFGRETLEAQLGFAAGRRDIPDTAGRIFMGLGAQPDPDRLGCALQLVRSAAARAPKHAKPGVLTAAAWLAWALGRSSHAGAYVDEALRIDPDHTMAALISSLLSAAMLPEWVLQRASEAR